MAWHPIGHILCSGSNDHTVKFWTRNRPGDQMRDKYNLNTLPPSLAGLEDYEMDDHMIPGMGEFDDQQLNLGESQPQVIHNQINNLSETRVNNATIPGLDLDVSAVSMTDKTLVSSKPRKSSTSISKPDEFYGTTANDPASILDCVRGIIRTLVTTLPGIIRLEDLKPQSIQIYGKDIDVIRTFLA